MRLSDAARYEIDFRLRLKERDYEDAVLAAHGVTFDAVADDGLVVAGQPVSLSLLAVNRGGTDVSVSDVTIAGFDPRPAPRLRARRARSRRMRSTPAARRRRSRRPRS